jgi:hypothetical protein
MKARCEVCGDNRKQAMVETCGYWNPDLDEMRRVMRSGRMSIGKICIRCLHGSMQVYADSHTPEATP